MIIFSSNSISSIGRSADRKALTVMETSSGSVLSGTAAATTYEKLSIAKKLYKPCTDLIDQLATVHVIWDKDLCPQLRNTTLDQIACLLLEHRVLVRDRYQLFIAKSLGIRNVRKVWVASLTEFTDEKRFI
jgi:hypothetical protein